MNEEKLGLLQARRAAGKARWAGVPTRTRSRQMKAIRAQGGGRQRSKGRVAGAARTRCTRPGILALLILMAGILLVAGTLAGQTGHNRWMWLTKTVNNDVIYMDNDTLNYRQTANGSCDATVWVKWVTPAGTYTLQHWGSTAQRASGTFSASSSMRPTATSSTVPPSPAPGRS